MINVYQIVAINLLAIIFGQSSIKALSNADDNSIVHFFNGGILVEI